MSDFLAHVIAELDTSKAQSQLESFTNQKATIDVDINLTSKNGNINSYLNQIKSQFGQAGNSAGQSFANSMNSSLGSINTNNVTKEIGKLKSRLQGLNVSNTGIDNVTKDLNGMFTSISKVQTVMNNGRLRINITGTDSVGRTVTAMRELDAANINVVKSSERVTSSLKKAFTSTDVSKLSSELSSLETGFAKLKGTTNQYNSTIDSLKLALSNLDKAGDLDQQQAEFDRIRTSVDKLKTSLKSATSDYQRVANAQQLLSSKTVLSNQIETWMNNNTKAAKIYSTELQALKKNLNAVSTAGELKAVTNSFKELRTTAEAAGNTGSTFLGALTSGFSKLGSIVSMAMVVRQAMAGAKEMINTVIELDTALVDLQKTTTMNSSQLESFYTGANDIAKQMGVATAQIIEQASAWSRLGL